MDLVGIPQQPFARDAKCPLDGGRVLDLSRVVAGNMVSLLNTSPVSARWPKACRALPR
jgi:predicted component of type VI protein secretion system